MTDFKLAAYITADSSSIRKELLESSKNIQLFGKETEKVAKSTRKAMGEEIPQAVNKAKKAISETSSAIGGQLAKGFDNSTAAAKRNAKTVGGELPAAYDKARVAAEKYGTATRKSMREAEDAVNQTSNSSSRSMSAFGGMVGRYATGAAFAGLALEIGKVGVGFHDFVSKSEMAFETTLGSAEKAKTYMGDILSFAKQTPFSFPELTESAQQMIAFGVDSGQVISILRDLGDAAVGAGGGITELQGLATVIGQISAKGRLQNEEILQLAERGLPALRILANQANMSTADYQKLVSTGAVSSKDAIDNLMAGLRDGTDGVNGMTAAYGGLMDKLKQSGNLSSTWDSIKSTFRNMAAALTESLLPAILGLLGLLKDLMGIITTVASVFNLLPEPVQTGAVALLAFATASKLFGASMTNAALAGVGKFILGLKALYLEQVKSKGAMVELDRGARRADSWGKVTATGAQRAAAGLGVLTTGAKTAGSALLGIFGGPIGLAVTGGLALITGAFAAHSQAVNQARDFVKEYTEALEEAGGKTTEASDKIFDEMAKKGPKEFLFFGDEESFAVDAQKVGLSLQKVKDAIGDGPERVRELRDSLHTLRDGKVGEIDLSALKRVHDQIGDVADAMERERVVQNALEAEEKQRPKTVQELASAYRESQWALHGFNEETEKAIEKYSTGFGDAFASGFSTISGFKATVVTAEQYASAQEKVAAANRKVASAQNQQGDLSRQRTTSKQRADAAKTLTEALVDQKDAYKALNELTAKDKPVPTQMEEYYAKTLEDAEDFSNDISALIEKGLDPKLIEDLIKKGPENAAGEMKSFLSVNGDNLISLANQTEETLNGLNGRVVENARLAAIAMNSDLASVASDLPLAMKIAAAKGTNESMSEVELASMLGVTSDDVKRVAASFGQDWVTTVEEEMASKIGSMPFAAQPQWQVSEEDSAGNFVEKQADGVTIQPRILVDPLYDIITTPEEYLRSQGGGTSKVRKQLDVSKHLAFASGGVMPGYTPGRDVHRFFSTTGGILDLSGGEAFMRPEFTRAVGGEAGVARLNALAMSGNFQALQSALYKPLGHQAFANGGVFGTAPSVVEVPVSSRVEHHGTTIIENVNANDPLEFSQAMRNDRKNRNTFG